MLLGGGGAYLEGIVSLTQEIYNFCFGTCRRGGGCFLPHGIWSECHGTRQARREVVFGFGTVTHEFTFSDVNLSAGMGIL